MAKNSFSEMQKPSSYNGKRKLQDDISSSMKKTNYKELPVFIIAPGLSIQKVGKGIHKKKRSEVDLRGVAFPDDLESSFHHGLIDENYVLKESEDQEVPNSPSLLAPEEYSIHDCKEIPTESTWKVVSNKNNNWNVIGKSTGEPKKHYVKKCDSKIWLENFDNENKVHRSHDELASEESMFPTSSKTFAISNSTNYSREYQLERRSGLDRTVPKTPLLLSASSKSDTKYTRTSNNLQVVPQTPMLKMSDSTDISGQIHRNNSGFQVPETPMLFIGRSCERLTTIVKETPLLPKPSD